jgi:membrane protease YdiL (CAAX protease family)
VIAIGAGVAGQWAIQRIADSGHANSNALINDGIALTVALYLIVGAIVIGFVRTTHVTLRWHEGDPLAAVGSGLLRGLLLGGGIAIALHAATGHLQGDSRFTDLISENNPVRILFTILLMVCAAPLVEETLFRGILLESWRSHAVWSVVVSGFAFAAWHLNGSAIGYYWLMGLILGRVYLRRGLIGSMATHAAFNAVVLGITIASISGSGHTVSGDGIRAHVPASWHVPAGTSAARQANSFVLDGPSGAQIDLLAKTTHTQVLSPTEAAGLAAEAMSTAIARVPGRITTAADEIELPLGAGERICVSDGSESADLYVIVSATHSYEVLVDTAGSATATKQAPSILESLREN